MSEKPSREEVLKKYEWYGSDNDLPELASFRDLYAALKEADQEVTHWKNLADKLAKDLLDAWPTCKDCGSMMVRITQCPRCTGEG
jgi:hypothetical protein